MKITSKIEVSAEDKKRVENLLADKTVEIFKEIVLMEKRVFQKETAANDIIIKTLRLDSIEEEYVVFEVFVISKLDEKTNDKQEYGMFYISIADGVAVPKYDSIEATKRHLFFDAIYDMSFWDNEEEYDEEYKEEIKNAEYIFELKD